MVLFTYLLNVKHNKIFSGTSSICKSNRIRILLIPNGSLFKWNGNKKNGNKNLVKGPLFFSLGKRNEIMIKCLVKDLIEQYPHIK